MRFTDIKLELLERTRNENIHTHTHTHTQKKKKKTHTHTHKIEWIKSNKKEIFPSHEIVILPLKILQ